VEKLPIGRRDNWRVAQDANVWVDSTQHNARRSLTAACLCYAKKPMAVQSQERGFRVEIHSRGGHYFVIYAVTAHGS
jgi:hypothetical protein